ncbi:MAG: hypothetical protein ACPL28_07245 [bacterium]
MRRITVILILVFLSYGAVIAGNCPALPKLTGDEVCSIQPIPYLDGRQGPGDIIGFTWYDLQANGSTGQRIIVDNLRQAHIDWMKMDSIGISTRRCE